MKPRRPFTGPALLSFFALLAVSGTALGQLEDAAPARVTPLPSFGRGLAGTEDATQIVGNPANLAFLPGGELRYSAYFLDDRALLPYQGHALAYATPISFLSLGAGLRLDLVNPPTRLSSLDPAFRDNYQVLTAALAYRPMRTSSIGVSYKHVYSDNPSSGGIDAWSAAISTRPADFFGLSFVASDIASPESRSGRELGASYDIATAIRPLGTQTLELGLEAKYLSERGGYWVPRATLGVDIPALGRLRGEVQVIDPAEESGEVSWLASALMSFNLNGPGGALELGAGTFFGDALGPAADNQAQDNWEFDVALKAYRDSFGLGPGPRALRVRLEETPDARDHVALLRTLWQIAEREPRVTAVVLELRASPADSLAHAEELRDAVHHLRKHGKIVLCSLEDADGTALYLCSAANRILINPAGGIRFAGLRSRYVYFKGLLDKVGVNAEFVRIGEHKSAPEMYTRTGSSDVTRADKIDLLTQFERRFTTSVSLGRKIPGQELRRRIATGPFIAEEAQRAGLVDELVFDDQIEKSVSDALGARVSLGRHREAARAPGRFGAVGGIALIYVEGDMVDGRSRVVPFLGLKTAGSYTLSEALEQARRNPMIGAIVLRVETGGGSALAADVLYREVQRAAKTKPVIVSMGSIAASGGYYIAAPATRIYANPSTVTGSIGIFIGKADVSELLRKIGVNVEVFKTTPRADADAFYRPFTPEERKTLEKEVSERYELFLSRVAAGRKLTKKAVDAVGQGRVWTGQQAEARHLVDELGGLRQALAHARELADLPSHAPIYELPEIETSLVGRILGIEGVESKTSLIQAFPTQFVDLAKALAPFAIHPKDIPLARIEFAEIDP